MNSLLRYKRAYFSTFPTPASTHAEFELTPIVSIGIFIGILTVLICIIIAVAAAFKLRATQAKQHTTTGGKRPGNLPIKEKISLPLSQSEDMYDEKNPDVVPSNEDPDYKLISANQTPTALHNSLCNSKHDIIGRTILDDSRKTYLTGHMHIERLITHHPAEARWTGLAGVVKAVVCTLKGRCFLYVPSAGNRASAATQTRIMHSSM
uniref:Uncharacterized protein n=1 Tax=Anopheles maculatus TaxID=74869 RepID=A0A182SRE2_9DIPT